MWSGEATASSAENKRSSGGLVGMLVSALIDQIVET
ncbi:MULTISPECIES: GNA1162 family protein [unclassified Diaphorobacter]|nr:MULTISPECIES: GNA1162 family protein [unclassified Diaphorobacter]